MYRLSTRTSRPSAIVWPMRTTGAGLAASRANLWLNFARLLPRSSSELTVAPAGHRDISRGPAVSPAAPRMMSPMSQFVADVSAVVTAGPTVAQDAPAVVPGTPLSWADLQPESDVLQQVLHQVTDRNRAVYDA